MIKLKRRESNPHTSERLLNEVEQKFNEVVWTAKKRGGFSYSEYIDEWFDWAGDDANFWSMANHLFLVDTSGGKK